MGCGASVSPASAPAPGMPEGGTIRSVIIWGATGLRNSDTVTKSDPYCIARIGPKNSAWNDKLRGTGRRSEPWHGSVDPQWRMAFSTDVAKLEDPELHIRIFDADWVGADDFLGEAKASLSNLQSAPSDLEVKGAHAMGSVSVSAGTASLLKEHRISASAFYEHLGPMGKLKSVKVDEITGDGPLRVGTAPLPDTMQGLFWLTKQGDSSALASFAGPTKDGAGCSTGHLINGRYTIRVGGDRVWAFADNAFSNKFVEAVDLIYHFVFNDGAKPTKCQIYPEAKDLGVSLTAEWILDFEGEIAAEGSKDFPSSVVWQRPSFLFGKPVGEYDLVQVMNGAGERLEPAWSAFREYQMSEAAGARPGEVFYHEVE